MRPVVYIACPYAADPARNVEKAKGYCRFALDEGAIPVCPIVYLPQFMSEETERDLATSIDMVFLLRCDEVWVMGDTISAGMKDEIALARESQMRIRYFGSDLKEVRHR